MPEPLDHLFIAGFTEARPFKSTLSVRKTPAPQRDREPHGQHLLNQLASLTADAAIIEQRRIELELPGRVGMTIAIEVTPAGAIDYQQLEWRRDGIEVLSVVDAGGSDIVALHVPDGRLAAFEKRVRDYLTKDTVSGKPANAALVNAIGDFRKAVFDELWTDEIQAPPEAGQAGWCQVWLRHGGEVPSLVRDEFEGLAARFGIAVDAGFVTFPGRVVVAAHGSREALEAALELLDKVAEIRGIAPTAEFFLSDLKPFEQVDWVHDLQARTSFGAAGTAPYVTLLDTGVNHGHPLLAGGLEPADMHTVDPTWNTTDHHGHGTAMAGLALHGNLTSPLASAESNSVPHRLESVKILPPTGQTAPHLYGWVTAQAAAKVEAMGAERRRTFAMMTTSVGKTAGLPSEWSSTIDRLAFGFKGVTPDPQAVDEASSPRLFVLAAGNVSWPDWGGYPGRNDLSPIENPGQAWNALTVGACTHLTHIDTGKWPSLTALAPAGLLSPSSTTSLLWRRTWPFKPDVVAEGGSGSLDAGHQVVVGPESLRVLTTSHDMATTPITESGDTSAAAAEVARICGHLSDRYATYWPETIRALVVHGARHTAAMRGTLPIAPLKKDKESLLRRYGYGAVDLDGSLYSTGRRTTLVLQETITPYQLDGGDVKLGGLNMHALPWPVEALEGIADKSVVLRVTLSYFVEPNPSRRGWQSKFRYQSHGLRFAVKGSTETDQRFGQRINKLEREEREEGDDEALGDPDLAHWSLGAQLRSRGSIHSDEWRGNAAQLAAKSHIAVFPVGGWWKDWKESERYETEVRYALVITLEVLDEVDVDLYTPIAAMLQVPAVIQVPAAGD
jgi:hypothetical protein